MRKVLLLTMFCCLMAAFCAPSLAQTSHPQRFTTRLMGTVVVKDVPDKYNALVYNTAMPETEGEQEAARLDSIKAVSARKFPRKAAPAQKKTTSVAPPAVHASFVADSNTGIPPDNYLAVSTGNKAVSVINQTFAVHDATTGAYLYRKSLAFVSNAVGLNNVMHDFRYDPKIMYDPGADRFITVMLNGTDSYNFIVIGFSKTNDPAGAWNFYRFYGDYTADTTWFDYPAISITNGEFFLTGNKIKYDSSWQAGFTQTLVYQINKWQGYNGDTTLSYQIWDSIAYGGRNLRCLHPVKPGVTMAGPAQYFLSNRNFDVSNDTVFLVKISDSINGTPTLTVTPLVSSLSYGVPPNARQTDTGLTLATNDGRILGAFMEHDEIQFVNTSVYPATGSSAIYHGVIRNVTGAPTVTGGFIQVDTLDMGYPNISCATTGSGPGEKSIITFNYSGPRTFPAFGAVYYDGTGYSDMVTIKKGDTTISQLTQKEQRWGDYSGSQPQWGNSGIVWAEGIYGRRRSRSYGCWIAQLYAPGYEGVEDPIRSNNAKLYPNPAFDFVTMEFTLPASAVVTFTICTADGRVVDRLPEQYCREGNNVLQFNASSLPSGMYTMRISSGGAALPALRFVRK
ncbi:MAG: T9SS C-terminal target domain-containing protein [Chitinophagia bacterium]|nr:T9SS C-terminal target domain-containing protein [Chitinophagia bacterium]